jgi:thiamine-phosphate pyrophosphorylase
VNVALPAVLVLTDRVAADGAGHDLADVVSACAGLDVGVVLREKDLARPDRAVLATAVADAARGAAVPLIVASDPRLASLVGAAGVHLASVDPQPSGWEGWIGRSCHDEVELLAARSAGADYVTLSPVFETPSKPGYGPALGPEGLRRLAAAAPAVRVYALAGVTAARVAVCVGAGAHGVAVQGAVMTASDPATEVARLAAAVHEARAAVVR